MSDARPSDDEPGSVSARRYIVLVTGGREFINYELLKKTLDDIHKEQKISCIVHGGARGTDSLAEFWAKTRGIEVKVFEADWDKHGKAAGPIRNRRMLREGMPNLVVVFPGGSGTENMIEISANAGIEIRRVR